MKDKIEFIAFDADDTLWESELYIQEFEHKFCNLLRQYVHTDVLPIIFFNLYGNGATICLLIWLNGQTVMPFMKRMYG